MVAKAIKSNQAIVKVNLNLCNPNRNLSNNVGPVQSRLLLSADEYDELAQLIVRKKSYDQFNLQTLHQVKTALQMLSRTDSSVIRHLEQISFQCLHNNHGSREEGTHSPNSSIDSLFLNSDIRNISFTSEYVQPVRNQHSQQFSSVFKNYPPPKPRQLSQQQNNKNAIKIRNKGQNSKPLDSQKIVF